MSVTLNEILYALRAPFPIYIQDFWDDAIWPSIPRYVLGWQYSEEDDIRRAIREADSEAHAEHIAACKPPRFSPRDNNPNRDGLYEWPYMQRRLWRRAIFERIRQDTQFQRLLRESDCFGKLNVDYTDFHGEPDFDDESNLDDEGLTEEDFVKSALRVNVARVASMNSVQLWNFRPQPVEMLPFLPPCSIGWRMGFGESYVYAERTPSKRFKHKTEQEVTALRNEYLRIRVPATFGGYRTARLE